MRYFGNRPPVWVLGYRNAHCEIISPGIFVLHVDLQYCALFPSLLVPPTAAALLYWQHFIESWPDYKAVISPNVQMTLLPASPLLCPPLDFLLTRLSLSLLVVIFITLLPPSLVLVSFTSPTNYHYVSTHYFTITVTKDLRNPIPSCVISLSKDIPCVGAFTMSTVSTCVPHTEHQVTVYKRKLF